MPKEEIIVENTSPATNIPVETAEPPSPLGYNLQEGGLTIVAGGHEHFVDYADLLSSGTGELDPAAALGLAQLITSDAMVRAQGQTAEALASLVRLLSQNASRTTDDAMERAMGAAARMMKELGFVPPSGG